MARDVPDDLPRVLSVAAANRFGLSRAAVRHRVTIGQWRSLARGLVLTDHSPPTRDDWILVAMELCGPSAAVSGWDAARSYGLGDRAAPGPVLVLDRQGTHRTVGGVVIRPTRRSYGSWLLPEEHPTLPYIPIVNAARAVVDTALMYRSLAPVRALVTSSVQRGVCTPEQLSDEYAACPRNGSGPLRRALEDTLGGARSIAEAEAIDWLARERVPSFEANVALVTAAGVVVATADVFWRSLRAVAEIDSREFHFTEADWTNTTDRHNLLTGHSLALQHYPPAQIRRRKQAWAADVARWLRARTRELGVPYVPGSGLIRPGPDGPPPYVLDA